MNINLNRRLDDLQDLVGKLDGKMDSTCERLTIQETNFKNHIDGEKSERRDSDKKIDRKYAFWTVVLGIASTILTALQIKEHF